MCVVLFVTYKPYACLTSLQPFPVYHTQHHHQQLCSSSTTSSPTRYQRAINVQSVYNHRQHYTNPYHLDRYLNELDISSFDDIDVETLSQCLLLPCRHVLGHLQPALSLQYQHGESVARWHSPRSCRSSRRRTFHLKTTHEHINNPDGDAQSKILSGEVLPQSTHLGHLHHQVVA